MLLHNCRRSSALWNPRRPIFLRKEIEAPRRSSSYFLNFIILSLLNPVEAATSSFVKKPA
ncbi:uncharacterized protein AFUA_8G01650 [Aspergillus fumigatus Af293]|uniref:Uncharacterized protein n=1 Tax=Aspergillus fumigatus (strain ATCC MYA-4609 / CBS 101355 / FGSC A1100 / Af293) TaxID=330879 RepID=Q4WBA9_ASPFU|nr:hypothetical protein AFUA_8G01650 [Aspergillus fumigatus Af293]EAL85003.1 hypothetical protein AFUA_8G01650 [Aspergillus fumigatus Af293]